MGDPEFGLMESISEISPLLGGFAGCGIPYIQEETEDA